VECAILAGGLATRMRPLTENIPKALIDVNGRPFVDWQLELLASQGVTSAVFCVGYRGEAIRDYVGDGARWRIRCSYVDEGTDLRGTAGALRLALDRGELQDRFLVLYGDSYLLTDYRKVWTSFLASGRPALMTVFRNAGEFDESNVIFEQGEVKLYDKRAPPHVRKRMEYIDYGLSALSSACLQEQVASGETLDLSAVFKRLSERGGVAGVEVFTRFYEIGSPSGLDDLKRFLALRRSSDP
jgi:N-acetyl-alpha-D-muramate 1-phosphate uridylyltransferase